MKHVLFNDHQDKSIYYCLTILEQILTHSCGFQQTFTKDLLLYKELYWIKALPKSEWIYDQLYLLEHPFWNMGHLQTFQSYTFQILFHVLNLACGFGLEYNGKSHYREVVKICKSKEILLFIISKQHSYLFSLFR